MPDSWWNWAMRLRQREHSTVLWSDWPAVQQEELELHDLISNMQPDTRLDFITEDKSPLCVLDRIFDDVSVFIIQGDSYRGKNLENLKCRPEISGLRFFALPSFLPILVITFPLDHYSDSPSCSFYLGGIAAFQVQNMHWFLNSDFCHKRTPATVWSSISLAS